MACKKEKVKLRIQSIANSCSKTSTRKRLLSALNKTSLLPFEHGSKLIVSYEFGGAHVLAVQVFDCLMRPLLSDSRTQTHRSHKEGNQGLVHHIVQ